MSAVESETKSDLPIALVADKLGPVVIESLNGLVNIVADPSLSGEALTAAITQNNPRILIVRSTKVLAEHIEAASNLGLIVRAGAGTNNIHTATASARGIYVANCPGANAIAVAELVMGHIINMDRKIAENVMALRLGQWCKKHFASQARGLYGRTIAILGVGQIGIQVAKRAQAFGMHVKGNDPFLTRERAAELDIEYCETPAEAARGADILTVHVPLLDATRNLVNSDLMLELNDGAYVLNLSRGGILQEEAIAEMAELKKLRFALDVYENEPKASDTEFKDDRISSSAHVYGTHHIGASTEQSANAVGQAVVNNVIEFLNKGSVTNAVNMISERTESYSVNVRHAMAGNALVTLLGILSEDGLQVQQMENKVFGDGLAGSARIQVSTRPNDETLQKIRGIDAVFSAEVGRISERDRFF